MAKLETVIQSGIRSAQPAATAVGPGTLYQVTDENNIAERSNGTVWSRFGAGLKTVSRGVTVSGTITTGNKGMIRIPVASTIKRWTLYSDAPIDIVFGITKDAPGSIFPPTTSIVASAPPTLVADDFAENTTLTGWTTAVAAGDVLRFSVSSVTGAAQVTLQLDLEIN